LKHNGPAPALAPKTGRASRHVNAALKDELGEQHMHERLIVVATSNDASGTR
jgi:hypothetical protein